MIRPVVYSLIASLALNTAGLYLVGRSFRAETVKYELIKQQRMAKAARENIFFDFIESPSVLRPQKPKKARKISNQDSVSRDLLKDKAGKEGAPRISQPGPADQLAQLRPNPRQNPEPQRALKAKDEMRKAPAQPEPAKDQQKTRQPEKKPAEGVSSKNDVLIPEPQIQPQRSAPQVKPSAPESPINQKKQPELKASSGKKELSGIDRINTQQMSRTKTRGAQLFGVTSFDAMGSDMGVYMKNVKERVWLNWFPYLAFQYPTDFQAADAYVSFTLNEKGEVKQVKLLDSFGSSQFSTFCVEAVQRASGFGTVPKEILALLGKDEVEIKFSFHYR